MTEWIRCPRCGRERPSTYYAVSRETGERRDVCQRCHAAQRREEWLEAHPRQEDPARGRQSRHWTSSEDALIREGAVVDEVCRATGRTANAVRKRANGRGLVSYMGVLTDRRRVRPQIYGRGYTD
jgi:hypothetical protein